jgi:outer membrane protein TolC
VAPSPAPEEEPLLAPGTPTIGLGAAVAMALERNFGIVNAAESVALSRLAEATSRAQFYPQLTPRFERSSDNSLFGMEARQRLPWTGGSVTAGATLTSRPGDTTPFPRSTDLHLVVSQPLLRDFGPNSTFYDLRNSRRERQKQEREYAIARQQLALDVARSYYEVIQQRQLLAVARQSYRRSESLRKASQARLEVGLVSKLDVYRAELQASQAQESMLRAETSLQSELERFRTRLGLGPTDGLEPEDTRLSEEMPADDIEPLEVLIERALQNRLELQEGSDRVDDARRTAALARQNLLPRVDVNVAMSAVGFGTSYGSAFREADRRVNVFLSSTYPLERSTDVASKARAAMAVEASRRTFLQLRITVETEVRTAVRELASIRKSLELQKKGVEVAEQQRRLATLRYQRGLASNFDVVDAEASLVLARSALVNLLTRYQVAKIDLLKVTGTLDVEKEFAP